MPKKLISFCGAITLIFGLTIQANAQVPGPLRLAQTIPLTGLKNGDFSRNIRT